ncbi:MAG: hypothetical protein ACLQF1_03295 [Methyloceanibacter sp.]
MPLNLDGMVVLRAIAANSRLFADVVPDASKHARSLVTKQLKAKTSDLSTLRAVKKALGGAPFTLIVDGMSDSEVRSLVRKLDKYHPDIKAGTPTWGRTHLRALADGNAEPTEKPQKAIKPKPQRKAKAPRQFLDLQSMKVTRPRRS